MIIVDGDHDDATVDQIVTQVDTWVQGENGSLAKTDKWGKRRFAYEINHKTEGHYVVLEMQQDKSIWNHLKDLFDFPMK